MHRAKLWALSVIAAAWPLAGHAACESNAGSKNGSSFLPVPIFITEPAVGNGFGGALLMFRDTADESKRCDGDSSNRAAAPDVAAVAAFKTGNGSKGAAAGYNGSASGDRYRYLVAAGDAKLNLDLYGLAGTPRRFTLSAPVVVAQGLARIGESDWFAGLRYVYAGGSVRFERSAPAEIPWPQLEARIGRASLVVDFDSRDNTFTPSRGTYAELDAGMARPSLGSGTSYESVTLKGYTWSPLGSSMVLGLRGDAQFSRGDVPFYARPFISLRGIPAMRYQGRDTYVGEAELRYNLTPRWAFVGFAGAGASDAAGSPFVRSQSATAAGLGFRYLVLRKLGLYAGIDVARGPEKTVFYLQVGSAWR